MAFARVAGPTGRGEIASFIGPTANKGDNVIARKVVARTAILALKGVSFEDLLPQLPPRYIAHSPAMPVVAFL